LKASNKASSPFGVRLADATKPREKRGGNTLMSTDIVRGLSPEEELAKKRDELALLENQLAE
jgi:hypothetical protein